MTPLTRNERIINAIFWIGGPSLSLGIWIGAALAVWGWAQ